MTPVFFPAQGGPAVLGLGSLLPGGLLPGLDPLGVLQLQGLLGFGADGRGLELFSDLPLEPFGVDPRPGHGAGGKRWGERQVFPMPLEKGIDLIILGLCPKGNLADLVQAFLFPFVKPNPEGSLEGDGEGGNCRVFLGSSFLGSYGEGTTKEAGY